MHWSVRFRRTGGPAIFGRRNLFESGRKYLPLPFETRNFDAAFKWSMLEAVTAAVSLDKALDGVATRSDNWQALNTLKPRW